MGLRSVSGGDAGRCASMRISGARVCVVCVLGLYFHLYSMQIFKRAFIIVTVKIAIVGSDIFTIAVMYSFSP